MMESMHIPCQVCSVTSTKGEITPLWVRFIDEDGELQKIDITGTKKSGANGIHTYFLKCTGMLGEQACMIKLSLDPGSMKWSIIGKMF